MRFARPFALAVPALAVPALALALTLAPAREAAACGGCFHVPSENTQVASHRMVLSISQAQSTLYDQIQYSGDPSSFAWVLPIKGPVSVGLSSDALFAELDQVTQVTVSSPNPCPQCPPPPVQGPGGSGSSSSGGGGVTVISQMVVGPYETVQLSSANPTALTDWLSAHGYTVPAAVSPIIAAYVAQSFDFLALKLAGGNPSITAMQPVRVTTPGASPVLPLRMVAAGAGVTVPITLFVVGEGRYQPENFPWFTIDPSQLVWDFSTESSNYKELRQAGFTASAGKAWLVESAMPVSEQLVTGAITQLAAIDPVNSGYADGMGAGAPMAAQADLDALFSGIDASSLWITRLLAELPSTALSTDLTVGAATSQAPVTGQLTAPKFVNGPTCPCSGATSSSSSSSGIFGGGGTSGTGASGTGGTSGTGGAGTAQNESGCAVGGGSGAPFTLAGLLTALALGASRRRRPGRR